MILLSDTDSAAAAAIVGTMAATISEDDARTGVEGSVNAVTFGVASAPVDGTNAEDLVKAARSRVSESGSSSANGSIH